MFLKAHDFIIKIVCEVRLLLKFISIIYVSVVVNFVLPLRFLKFNFTKFLEKSKVLVIFCSF